jgi:putative membrane protein
MRSIVHAAMAAFLLASGGASAGEKVATVSPVITQEEEQAAAAFARSASLAGLFDVEAAQLALDRAKDAAVRKLAREIIEEQSLANSRLLAFAPKYAQTKLDPESAARLERLKNAKAEDFDRAFLAIQKQSHADSVKLLSEYAHSGGDKVLKGYASETLSFVTLHQTRVNSLQ